MYTLFSGDCFEIMRYLPDQSVQCCVTSPPYFGLRDYGTAVWVGGTTECKHNPQRPDGGDRSDRSLPLGRGGMYRDVCGKCGAVRVDEQIGLEQTPEDYVARLVKVFYELKRILKDDGTLWLNLGDSYAGSNKGIMGDGSIVAGKKQQTNHGTVVGSIPHYHVPNGMKSKDLIGIPWMVAFALRADGWYLRSDIIWHKPNPMPESVRDRPTKSYEHVFLLSKNPQYYFDQDAVREPSSSIINSNGRNIRDVWTITTRPYRGAHFATFPSKLIEPCILAGSKVGDIVLDPFNGAGTTGLVALQHGREYVGIDLNPTYLQMTRARLEKLGVD